MQLNDDLVNVGVLLRRRADIYSLQEGSVGPSTYIEDETDQIVGSVVFSVSKDQVRVSRVAYGFLDYLADIGGLYGTFNGFATVITLILNYNGVYHLLTSGLFTVETDIIKREKPKYKGSNPARKGSAFIKRSH